MRVLSFVLSLLFTLQTFAAAPLGFRGSADTTSLYPSTVRLPNTQVTNVGSGSIRLETGNANILSNSSFEHLTFSTSWVQVVGAKAAESTIVIDGAKSYKATLTAQTLEIYQDSTRYAAQFADGVQGIASVRIKTSVSGIFVCPRQAGATVLSNCATVNNDNKWLLYKVPYVFGATSNGIAIVSGTMTNGVVTTSAVTGDVYVDDAYVGTDAGIADVSVITPWQSYTPTFTGFGTVTCSNCMQWRQVGSSIEIQGKFIPGTTTATEARMSLPNSFTASAIPSIQLAGFMARNANSTTFFFNSVLIEPSVSYVTFGLQTSTANALTKVNADASFISGQNLSLFASIPIANLAGSTQVFASSCGANCENEFSAKVSAAGVVSDESANFINGNCTGSSPFTCTFNSGIFTVAPNCTATAVGTGQGGLEFSSNPSSSSVIVRTQNTTTGNVANLAFNLICQKQGSDYQSSRTIVGSFKEVVTSPGISKPKTCKAIVGGASATLASPTECTTGTCVEIYDSCGTFTPPAWGSVAFYTNFSWAAGTWANNTAMDCECKAWDVTTSVRHCNLFWETGDNTISSSATGGYTSNLLTFQAAGTENTTYFQIECTGQAP